LEAQMPFRWSEIFKKENDIVKASADRAVDAHTDPHVLVALSIRQLQDDHDKLEHACAVVIGEYTTAKANLERDLEQERTLDDRGKAAAQAGHSDAAAAIAHQLVAVRGLLTTEQPTFDKLKDAAAKAQAAFQENSELLTAKMAEAKQLDAEIDQAAVEHNINETMKAVTSMTSHTTPSFDQVRDRVQKQKAEEEATAQLEGSTPELSEIHEQHLLTVAAADDVMSSWGSPASSQPGRRPVSGMGQQSLPADSPTDRLNA
jgi:phage shock protein A